MHAIGLPVHVLIGIAPLVLATVLYLLQAGGYHWILTRPYMALTFVGYAIANVGLIGDALTH